jgi:DNA-binding MarR family transcriptional regulator
MPFNHRKTVVHRLTQAARATRVRSGSQLTRIGLHAGQDAVLKALAETDGLTMSELAGTLNVQPPTVTKMVSRLASQGYIERRASAGDGRQAQVFLTEQGKETVSELDKILRRVERQALAGIDEKERKRLRKLLRQIEKNLGAGKKHSDLDDEDLLDTAAAVPA